MDAWPGKTQYDPGETVRIEARVRDRAKQPTEAASVEVDVYYPLPVESPAGRGEKLLRDSDTVTMEPIPVSGGRYQGSFLPPVGGIYRAVVRVSDGQGEIGRAELEFVVGRAAGEFDRVDVDEPAMRAIASHTGGRFHTLATARRIPEELERKRLRTIKAHEKDLWNEPAFFLAFLACVTLEWFLRKRHGLN